VFTAFSGSHQDAIRKGLKRQKECPADYWQMPYLPVDPRDVGRNHDQIIRFNSQSGKGGAAFILEHYYGVSLPKRMQKDFGPKVIGASDRLGKGLSPAEVYELFSETYVNIKTPLALVSYQEHETSADSTSVVAAVTHHGADVSITGEGSGPIDAFCQGLSMYLGVEFEITQYSQHATESGQRSKAMSYVEITLRDRTHYGAGLSGHIGTSSLRAVVSAVNRALVSSSAIL
jgi:2-isopropylmalate synthase